VGRGGGLLYQAHEAVGGVGHGLDGRVRHGFELGVDEFVLGADVNEGAFVAGAVAIVGGGEDWVRERTKSAKSKRFLKLETAPVMAFFGGFFDLGGGEGLENGLKLTSDASPVMLDLVPVHPHLVAADDRLQPVALAEALRDIGPELHADAALAGAAAGGRLWVRPQHFHHEAALTWLALLVAVQLADVVERDGVVGEEAAVQDEEFLAD